jgi:hypothetical protein
LPPRLDSVWKHVGLAHLGLPGTGAVTNSGRRKDRLHVRLVNYAMDRKRRSRTACTYNVGVIFVSAIHPSRYTSDGCHGVVTAQRRGQT